jgi:transmembrane sensor
VYVYGNDSRVVARLECIESMKPDPRRSDPLRTADWDALARYLAGESSPAEAQSVQRWLAEDPRRAGIVGRLGGRLSLLDPAAPAELDVDGALRAVLEKRKLPDVIEIAPRAREVEVGGGGWAGRALRIAAAVLLVIGAGLIYTNLRDRGPEGVIAEERRITSGVGEQLAVSLADGTEVRLGPSSVLTLAAGYGDDAREVSLEGEALFEVVHDEERPFVVRAGAARILDLGTVFIVRTLDGEAVRVAVTEGVVRLEPAADGAGAEGVTLNQGDRGVLTAGSRAIAEADVPLDHDLAWTEGRLVFRETPLSEVADALRRWYGVLVEFEDPFVADGHLTAEFADEPVAQVLETIALALGAEVIVQGDTATFRTGALGAP